MKITKKQLKQIIKEEINTALNETRLTPEQIEDAEAALTDNQLRALTEASRLLAIIPEDKNLRQNTAGQLMKIFRDLGHEAAGKLIPSLPPLRDPQE